MTVLERVNDKTWPSIDGVAPTVDRWRYTETLDYVRRIRANKDSITPR